MILGYKTFILIEEKHQYLITWTDSKYSYSTPPNNWNSSKYGSILFSSIFSRRLIYGWIHLDFNWGLIRIRSFKKTRVHCFAAATYSGEYALLPLTFWGQILKRSWICLDILRKYSKVAFLGLSYLKL